MMAVTLLDPARLPALLGTESVYFNVDSVAEIDSTNDELSRLVSQQGLPSGSVLVADCQTAGKGRQGRVWASDPEASLTFSLFWRFPVQPQQMAGLSLAVGLGLYRALVSLGAADIALKWPNDVLCRQRDGSWGKLAGILIELSPGKKGVDAIIGIGLNLFPLQLPPTALAVNGMRPSSLSEVMLLAPERHEVLAAILKHLRPIFQAFKSSGLATLKDAWDAAHAWQGQRVVAREQESDLCVGECLGIDADGALLLNTESGIRTVFVGDVSLRPAVLASEDRVERTGDPLWLCLDAGNTRLKWGLANSQGLVSTGICDYEDLSHLRTLVNVNQAHIQRVVLSNVAGARVEQEIQQVLDGTPISTSLVQSTVASLGVTNGYRVPESLGSDRWCALVGAWQRNASALLAAPCLVVSLGTATTIDALDAQGNFCGGMILPGITLMRQSLAERTALLPEISEMMVGAGEWPRSTEEAIAAGSIEATAGAINRAWHQLLAQDPEVGEVRCLLTGGAATLIQERLSFPVEVCEHLVLEGIRHLALRAT